MSDKAQEILRAVALEILGDTCASCGIDSPRRQVDHILPRSEFPHLALDPHNVQILCPDCNRDKGAGVFSGERRNVNSLDLDWMRLTFIARLVAELETRDIALKLIDQAQRQKRRTPNVQEN